MSIFTINGVELAAISACVPKKIMRVSEYTFISEQEQKMFTQGTGVVERRFAANETCASDMCFAAAQQLLKDNKVNLDEIDVLIFVSQSPDYYLPATSVVLQDRLGLTKSTIALDINLGCSGYIYGLSVLSNFLSLPGMRKGLLLCGDKSSPSINYKDKSTYPLFGDAGTASLLQQKATASPMHFNLQSDGSGKEAIIIKDGGTRHPLSDESFNEKEVELGITRTNRDLSLNGIEVFNFSLREVKPNVVDLIDYSKIQIEDLDYVVMHQANKLMNESVRKKLKISIEKVPYSLHKFGNTSSASIPLTIVSELQHKLPKTKKMLLTGFGVGFSWGSVLLETNNIKISNLVEID